MSISSFYHFNKDGLQIQDRSNGYIRITIVDHFEKLEVDVDVPHEEAGKFFRELGEKCLDIAKLYGG